MERDRYFFFGNYYYSSTSKKRDGHTCRVADQSWLMVHCRFRFLKCGYFEMLLFWTAHILRRRYLSHQQRVVGNIVIIHNNPLQHVASSHLPCCAADIFLTNGASSITWILNCVCVFVYVCSCMCVYLHIFMHLLRRQYLPHQRRVVGYIHSRVCVCLCVCVYVYTCICICCAAGISLTTGASSDTYILMCVCVNVSVYVCVCVCTHMMHLLRCRHLSHKWRVISDIRAHVCMRMCMCMCVYVHIHI